MLISYSMWIRIYLVVTQIAHSSNEPISFETVLGRINIIFQSTSNISCLIQFILLMFNKVFYAESISTYRYSWISFVLIYNFMSNYICNWKIVYPVASVQVGYFSFNSNSVFLHKYGIYLEYERLYCYY